MGIDTIRQITFQYWINNQTQVQQQTISCILAPNDSTSFQITTPYVSPVFCYYFLYVHVSCPFDSVINNDSLAIKLYGNNASKSHCAGAINEVSFTNFNVFPNPSHNQIYIEFISKYFTNNTSLHLINSELTELKAIPVKNIKSIKIDLRNYPSGVYFIQLQRGTEILGVEKVIRY